MKHTTGKTLISEQMARERARGQRTTARRVNKLVAAARAMTSAKPNSQAYYIAYSGLRAACRRLED